MSDDFAKEVQAKKEAEERLAKVVVPPVLEINGKKLQTSKASSITLGDQRKLKAAGVSLKDLGKTNDPDHMALLFLMFAQKMDPDLTEDDINTLTNNQMLILSKMIKQADEALDRPT